MAQQTISNGETGLATRTALNTMFTELYASVPMVYRLQGVNANTTFAVPANTVVSSIYMTAITGTPTIRVGTTPNGFNVQNDTIIGNLNKLSLDEIFSSPATLYITFTTAGTISVRFEMIENYF
jgi:hypothetical protein